MKSTITLSRGAVSAEINTPQYGYKTRIRMAMSITARADGKTGIFDNGREFDTRYCDADFILDEIQAEKLHSMLRTDARGEELQLLVHANINPFGPDFSGGDRRFQVRIPESTLGNAEERPYLTFPTSVVFAMASAPECALPPKRDQGGNMAIAGIPGFRQPEDWPHQDTAYSVQTVIGYGGNGASEDRTDNSDQWTATIAATCNESMAARLVHELTQRVRAKTFTITSSTGMYIFGRDGQSANSYEVQLSDPEISVVHSALDRYTVTFSVRLKDYISKSQSSFSNSSVSLTSVSVSPSSSSDSLSSFSNSSSSDSVSIGPSISISVSSSSDSVSIWDSISWWVPPY
jgi:hypothetical protein